MNTDLRPLLRAAALAAVALLAAGCVTQALVEDGSAGAYVPPSREQTAALQGRAFQLGQVTVAITHPEPPEVHPLPDEAYRRMLAAKLEQAFHAVDERPAGDRQPLVAGREPAWPVDVTITRLRFVEGRPWAASNASFLEATATVHDDTGAVIANLPVRLAGSFEFSGTFPDARLAHADHMPAAAAAFTGMLARLRNNQQAIDKHHGGPAAVWYTAYHLYSATRMTRAEIEQIASINLDAYGPMLTVDVPRYSVFGQDLVGHNPAAEAPEPKLGMR